MEEPAAMATSNSYFVMQNMDRVCRICLQETTNLSPIFSKTENEGNLANLQEKIQVCGAVECHEQDGLPALICEVCAYKATIAHEFRQLCQHSDIRLRIYYNKPTKFNATDSGTQTDLQMQTHFTSAKSLYDHYYVKQEVTNNQHFHDAIPNGGFNTATQTNSVATEMEPTLPAVHVSISDKEGELFNCHLAFEDQPKVENKSSEIATCDNQNVPCAQELIPVSTNLIHDVCTIEANVNHSEDVKNVTYFTYVTKETTPEEEQEQEDDNNIPKQMLTRKTKLIQTNDPIEITDMYYGTSNDSPEHSKTNENLEEMKLQCEVCSKFYSSEESFRKHQLTHEQTNYQCEICCKILSSPGTLEKHKKMHITKPHACQICHASFSKSQSLDKHMKSHNDGVNDTIKQGSSDDEIGDFGQADVGIGGSGEESEGDNSNENQIVELGNAQKVFNCEECGQCCSTLKNLRRHALIHGEKKYACTVCKKWFYRPDTLKKHAEKHGHGLLDNLSDNNKLYDSDDDAFPPDTNSSTVENVNPKKTDNEVEGNNGQYKCQSCDKVIATKKGLRRHVAMHKPKPEPSVCEICKKVCASQARLILHQKTHSKPKEKVPREYLCHICSKVYPSNSSLTYHMRTHTGIKPHVCKTCNSGFTTTTSLANHIRIHTGDKPFVCHVCSAAFAVSSAFRRHLTRHTGEANYLCKTCGKAFKRLSTLKEHTYTHSGEKPYVCKTCGAAYSHSGSLFAHQKRCRAQFNEIAMEDHHHTVAHHIHVNNVNNVQSSVRPLTEMSPF